jgi:glyoxylase I family protein
MTPDFVEFGPDGRYDRQALVAALLGEDPGTGRVDDFTVRELAPAVALVTYRSVIDPGPSDRASVSLRSSIWCREDGRWRMTFHHWTPAR